MIKPSCDQGVGTRASFLRKTFSLSSPGEAGTLFISALGLYRAFINGQRVGDDVLTPGWTSYHERLSFQTYDVSNLLVKGENTIDVWLGDGWLRSQMMWGGNPIYNTWGSDIGAIAELFVGDRLFLETDATWRSGYLPILKSGIYFGEIYDAREATLSADQGVAALPGFNKATLIAHEVNGVKELTPLPVALQFEDAEGRTIYDFGQNSAGYVRLEVEGEAGARVLVEHAEILDVDGRFENANMRSAEARLEYVLKGGGVETYSPTFTFQGFRYARVTIEGVARVGSIVSVPITSAIAPRGTFESGNALVNRLVLNTIWSQRANFIEVPTDCPQRDERLGWTGDAQVFAATACYLHDSKEFLRKYLRDVMADQREDGAIPHVSPDPTRYHEDKYPHFYGSTGWGDAICVIPWVLYTQYGDSDVLAETLDAMVRWNDFVHSISNGPLVRPPKEWGERGFTFGDWLQPVGGRWPMQKPFRTIGDDASATIYHFISSDLTAKAAEVLGRQDVAQRMRRRADDVRAAFSREFVTQSGRLVYDDQTSYALAILHDLVPAELLPATAEYFKAAVALSHGRIGTGFIGTPAVLPALVKIGATDVAAAVFLQEEVPGWLYQVKCGATTIWERWDAIQADGSIFDPQMNSYNHYAYGAVCQWLFEMVAGFRPDPALPGFKHIFFEPTIIPELSPVAAAHDSAAGRIEARWTVHGEEVTYDIAVPEGASGTLVLSTAYRDIALDGVPLAPSGVDEKARGLLAPGRHRVTFRISR